MGTYPTPPRTPDVTPPGDPATPYGGPARRAGPLGLPPTARAVGAVGATAGVLVVALGALPAQARAGEDGDRAAEPVAYANVASLAVRDDGWGRPGGSVISETQRSPATPGTSSLEGRSALPDSDGERRATGPNYTLDLEPHDVSATLTDSRVPAATARAGYTLTDRGAGTVLTFDAATSVRCPAPDATVAEASGSLSLLDRAGALTRVDLPDGTGRVRREGLPFGPPTAVGPGERAVSAVTVRRVSAFDDLLRQDGWRSGAVTAVSGWVVRIETRIGPDRDPEPAGTPRGRDTPATEPAADGPDTADTADTTDPADTGGSESGAQLPGQATVRDPDPGDPQPGDPQPGDPEPGAADAESSPTTAGQPGTTAQDTAEPESAGIRTVRTELVLGGVSCSVPTDFAPGVGGGSGRADGGREPVDPSVPVRIPAGAPGATTATGPAAGPVGWGAGLLGAGAALGAAAFLLARPGRGRPPEERNR